MPKRIEKKPSTTKEEVRHLKVYVEKGATVSLGDHNFAKILVGVELPYNPTTGEIKASEIAIQKAMEIVDDVLDQELESLGIEL